MHANSAEFAVYKDSLQNSQETILTPISLGKPFKIEIMSADILDNRFVLLGLVDGLYFLDLLQSPAKQKPVPVIPGIRFRQISIISEYNIFVSKTTY